MNDKNQEMFLDELNKYRNILNDINDLTIISFIKNLSDDTINKLIYLSDTNVLFTDFEFIVPVTHFIYDIIRLDNSKVKSFIIKNIKRFDDLKIEFLLNAYKDICNKDTNIYESDKEKLMDSLDIRYDISSCIYNSGMRY